MHSIFKYAYWFPLFWLMVFGIHAQAQAQQQSDSVEVQLPDSSLVGVRFYYRLPKSADSRLNDIPIPRLYRIRNAQEKVVVTWDSVSTFTVQRQYKNIPILLPSVLTFDEYKEAQKDIQNREIRFQLIEQSKAQDQAGKGLLDFKINVPGGEKSAFTTIFGKPEVNLRVNGRANMNVGASIQNLDDPSVPEELRRRVDPTFNQNLQLNISGTIGDKLTISTDWDTERQFDYQNRLSIVYEGYEDEIIKRVEMGNVNMETGNSLIQGGNTLFGIKSIAELGPLRVTSVISQQQGESQVQEITSGSQETAIALTPADYDDNRHFFLDFFDRQQYEANVANPQTPIFPYFLVDENVRLYVLRAGVTAQEEGLIPAIALTQFGVDPNGSESNPYGLPNNITDAYSDEQLDLFRDLNQNDFTADNFGVDGQDFVKGFFEPLQLGVDYTVSPLGYISLRVGLDTKDALAVSYNYSIPSEGGPIDIEVGEQEGTGSERIYLKLIRPQNITTESTAWPLTMRNIYSLGVGNIEPGSLELGIFFTRGNVEQEQLTGRTPTLLQDLGLDRLNTEGAAIPDNLIDNSGLIIDYANGRIIFPYLEPFGDRIYDLLEAETDTVRGTLSFRELYTTRKNIADEDAKNGFYRISGLTKGGISGTYLLGFALVEGSVKVFANGVQLNEGVDYDVDYSFGTITILNNTYLAPGQDIRVEYENNQLSIVGQKNFTGVRAEYSVNENISLGGTYFRLNEQPLTQKIRIGNEPINNTILGLDADAQFDTPWLTRFIDKVPLLQTKEPSNMSFSGEFAQLRPGVAQTNAVRDAISRGELFSDEENGLVFVDDFEGAEFSLSFLTPNRWNLASAPAAVPGYPSDILSFQNTDPNDDIPITNTIADRLNRNDLRSQFSWYILPRTDNIIRNFPGRTRETDIVQITDVFPGRQVLNQGENFINTLDVFYDPTQRGPYNYNMQLRSLLDDTPENTWGGMMAVLPSGQEDLTQNNIEFLEFWVQTILPGAREPTGADLMDYDGKIYIDLGLISEDVVPNGTLNTEDGLGVTLNSLRLDGTERSYTPLNQIPPQGQFSASERELEDVGFDGIPSRDGFEQNGLPLEEVRLFEDFVNAMRDQYGEESEAFQAIAQDPSNDDYRYFNEDASVNLPFQDRFKRMFGYHEGNTPVSGTTNNRQAITLRPDTEALISTTAIQESNDYFQYEVDFNPADLDNLEIGSPNTFIVDKSFEGLSSGGSARQDQTWYQIRIPINEFKRKIGSIEDFQNISYVRIWLSGYRQPFTIRFATFEFIGSQWRKVNEISEIQNTLSELQVATVNIEENGDRSPVPYRQPFGAIRDITANAQAQVLANEQSITLEVENLAAGEIQMVKRVYPGGLNLLNYSNMRMFVHGEGYQNREDAELVIRLGNDLENDFYEYRQPVTPTDPTFPFGGFNPDEGDRLDAEAEQVWLYDENSMNIVLSALNQLKQIRDQRPEAIPLEQLFELSDAENAQLLAESPPGARIAMKGNPSLDRISQVGVGIKNPFVPGDPNSPGSDLLNAQMWLNELRLSGFDNIRGWSANARANFKLADFATLNTTLNRQTTGFGGLESRLGQRRRSDDLGYTVSSTINLHKLIPDRYGWNFPMSISTRRSSSTPEFLPNQGDTRLRDFEQATNANQDLTPAQRQTLIDSTIFASQTVTDQYSINFSNISKTNSKSKLAEYTIDKTRLSYNYTQSHSRNPRTLFNDSWNYSTSASYNLTFRNVRLFRPFNFTKNIPIAKALAGLQLGYMPSSIAGNANLNRNYSESRDRQLVDTLAAQPLRQNETFNSRTSFNLRYNLTPNIPISYQSSTNFDLTNAGRIINPTDSTLFTLRSTPEVVRGLISDTLRARRTSYSEAYSASWRPRFNKIKPLNWITYSLSYGGGFNWQNSPAGSDLGATVSNSFRLDHTFKFNTKSLIDKIGFVDKLRDADKKETTERERAKKGRASGQDTTKAVPDIFADVGFIARKVALIPFSPEDVSFTYKNNTTTSIAGYGGESQFYYAFNDSRSDNFAPPLSFRLGFSGALPTDQLIRNLENITFQSRETEQDVITLGTRLKVFENVTIDLDWSGSWNERNNTSFTINNEGQVNNIFSSSGRVSTSSWSFGKGYEDFLERQLQTAFDDIADGNTIEDAAGNQDGRTVLNRRTLEDDFREAYLGDGTSGIGSNGFTPIPRPAWRVTWNEFEKLIPFLGQFMNRATLNHAYNGQYRLDWTLNQITSQQAPQSIGAYSVVDSRDRFEARTINVEQKFAPLASLNITWKSNLKTEIGMDRSRISSLDLSSRNVNERVTNRFKFSIAYTFRKVRIPIFPKIKNNIDIRLTGGISDDTDSRYLLVTDLSEALENALDPAERTVDLASPDPFITGQQRVDASIIIGYKFSSTITSNFEYTYNQVTPRGTRTLARTNQDIRFNIQIAIRSR
ncbi:MAG: cell surface protein SprA [Bacteroidota bacterium]